MLINPNASILFPNNKLGIKNKIIDEIINIAFNIKLNHSPTKVKIFTYKKFVKEISELNEENDIETEKERIFCLLIKEVGESPKTDIITSLSNLYTYIEGPLKEEKNNKKKILKIIIVNNEMEIYKNFHEKIFSDDKLQLVLKEFINEKSNYFGVELKYLDDRLILQKRKGFEKISDFPTGQFGSVNNELNEENINIVKSIYISDELLKKAEKMSLNLYKKWYEISIDEILNKGIENLDELLDFYKDVLNSILFMKNKISKNIKLKEKYVQKISAYISSENLNNKKNEIILSDDNESFVQEIKESIDKVNKINLDSFIKQLSDNKRYNCCICWIKICNYLIDQKKNIIQYLDILKKSKSLIELIEKDIIKKSREIINNDTDDEENDNDV